MAELSQPVLGSVAVRKGATSLEFRSGVLQFGGGLVVLSGLGQCVAGKRAREPCLNRCSDLIGRCRRRESCVAAEAGSPACSLTMAAARAAHAAASGS